MPERKCSYPACNCPFDMDASNECLLGLTNNPVGVSVPIKSKEGITFNDHQTITGSVAAFKDYWNTYDRQGIEDYTVGTLLNDALYGIGIAIDPEKYKEGRGYDLFKKDLVDMLTKKAPPVTFEIRATDPLSILKLLEDVAPNAK